MNLRQIRIFPRHCIGGSAKSEVDAREQINELIEDHIDHCAQNVKTEIRKTKRKRTPYDFEITYWDWKTLKQMAEYYINQNNEVKDD